MDMGEEIRGQREADKVCEFCERYESQKSSHFFKRRHPEYYDHEKWEMEITVAMVVRTWTKRIGKRNAGRITDYRYRGCGYKLNYCPECGRKIKTKEIKA